MKERIAFVDYIRVVACLMVMVVHASENFYVHHDNMSQIANESNRLWVAFYDGALGRISVPLFMIVSAFLLVPMKPGVTMSQFYRRRFVRILPPFILFLVLYALLPVTWDGSTWTKRAASSTTTIGYKRIVPLSGSTSNYSAVKAKYLRITVNDAKGCPTLHTLSVF